MSVSYTHLDVYKRQEFNRLDSDYFAGYEVRPKKVVLSVPMSLSLIHIFPVDNSAGADGHDHAGLRFFLSGRGKKESAFRLFFDVYAFDDNFVE